MWMVLTEPPHKTANQVVFLGFWLFLSDLGGPHLDGLELSEIWDRHPIEMWTHRAGSTSLSIFLVLTGNRGTFEVVAGTETF